jgi:iron complex transport system ATP-binding protein
MSPDPAAAAAVEEVVAGLGALGGFFEIGMGPVEPGWRPLRELCTDTDGLADRIADVAARLDTGEPRVAASIMFQGLAARLWSPPLAAAVVHDTLIDLSPGSVYWQAVPSGPLPLRAARLTAWEVRDPAAIAGRLYHGVLAGLLEPLAPAVQEIVKIAPGLLWGNAASALAGAVCAIARVRPAHAGRAVALGRELLSLGRLRGSGELVEPAPGQPFFVRRSCCLYYRVPGGGKCGDCSLLDERALREQWARAIHGS